MGHKLRENLIRTMHDKNLNQTKLARLAKIPKTTLHGYLNPKSTKNTKLDVYQLKKICDVLKVDFHEMLFGIPDPNSKVTLPQEFLQEIFKGDVRVTIQRIIRS